jgi:hypothetical protein
MANAALLRLARRWRPEPEDPFGEDKRILIQFLLHRNATSTNPKPIDWVAHHAPFTREYSRNEIQNYLMVPLRNDDRVFIGTSNAGIYLILSPEDADATLGFYTARIRSELKHARALKKLAKRTRLFDNYTSALDPGKERAVIYIDESGDPNINNLAPRVFVVGAVIIESRRSLAELEQRFNNAADYIRRPADQELRTAALSERKHALVLRELSLLEYQCAAACFVKDRLAGPGFADPTTLYRYAFQFLVGELLTIAWQAQLVIDENSTQEFQAALADYLRRNNSGLPVNRLQAVDFATSSKSRLIQLADLVAGAVRRSIDGERAPLRELSEKMVSLQYWPPAE